MRDVWRKSSLSGASDCVEICWHKANFSDTTNCVEVGWRKSSSSKYGDCVEVNIDDSRVFIRNSNHPDRGMLAFRLAAMRNWIESIKAGELDT